MKATALALPPTTLGALLHQRGFDPAAARALRVTLHPLDRSEDFPDLATLRRENALATYARMQDGRRLGADGLVLTFAAEPGGLARLLGAHRFVARRRGLVPGDIVYDYAAAHLLHSFIARARCPVFYDAFEVEELDDLRDALVLRWPHPLMRNVRWATDPGLDCVA